MTEPFAFALATFMLLAAPGPTNTLIATSGATIGLQRSAHLIGAVIIGYLVATLAVALIAAPLAGAAPILDISLRIACGLYLLYAAWRLWREGGVDGSGQGVRFDRVLIATSLNPKGIVFALVIVPFLSPLQLSAATPYLLAMAALAAIVAWGWIAIGALVRGGASQRFDTRIIRRSGAVILAVFAALIAGSAFTA